MLDTMPWNKTTRENTLCLVTAVLMEREGNLLNLDMSTWQQRSPGAWEHTKSLLPILECLHNIPMGPRDSHTYMDILVSLMLVEQEKRHKSAPRDIPVDPSIFAEPTMGKS